MYNENIGVIYFGRILKRLKADRRQNEVIFIVMEHVLLFALISDNSGVGIQFGPDVTEAFLKENSLAYVVRFVKKMAGVIFYFDGIFIIHGQNVCVLLQKLFLSQNIVLS